MEHQEITRRMHSGQLYYPTAESLAKEQLEKLDMLHRYNQLPPSKQEEKAALLKAMFAEIGANCYIETPFHSNWGGKNVHFGRSIYANFNLTLVDDTHIYVGDHVMFGPNVTVCTGTHPIHPELRKKQVQFNLPVTIGANVWIGANAILLPGVTIGENTVIGAGSVVTGNLPANVVAVGAPCRVLREIEKQDLTHYRKGCKIDLT